MSEAALWWTVSAVLVLAVFVPYFVQFSRRNRRDAARHVEARRLGIDRPVAQFPYVDATSCIGCGACVDACPEGDVLGIVGGTATVVNGMRCVGHGACETACPVGALQVGLGDLRSREDIPLLDDWNETSVPGLFIAGELGGLALIRNAVTQGRKVGERIAAKASRLGPSAPGAFDVAIIGAGPAGLSAALTALECGLRPVVLEQEKDLGGTVLHYPRRKLVLVQPVALPFDERLRADEYAKEDLLELLQKLLSRTHLDVRFGQRATDVRREGALFCVTTAEGALRARFAVLALGRRGTPRKLGVPGEELPKVMYKLIDAESYQRQRILVVGGGDSAVEAAIGLARQTTNDVTLSYRRDKIVRIKKKNQDRLAELSREERLRLVMSSEVEEIRSASVRLRVADRAYDIPNDYVFVFAGGEPPFAFLRQIGVRFGGGEGTAPSAASA
jgi:thioredoxin reductase/Pyruvate/2-oxoacid:ferredoxin oxidoreductase delta subunit